MGIGLVSRAGCSETQESGVDMLSASAWLSAAEYHPVLPKCSGLALLPD